MGTITVNGFMIISILFIAAAGLFFLIRREEL